jgi:4-hydroxy-tetrahydrodipicolinate reductase
MNVALVGYGRMGKEVEQVLRERGHKTVVRIDPNPGVGDAESLNARVLGGVDGVIEFSLPGAVAANARVYAQVGLPAVIGTTGWEAEREEVAKLIRSSGGCLLHGSNFSIGAHLMFALVRRAAEMIKPFEDYDIMVHEYHHKFKVDSPSGTALSIANAILENLPRKSIIQTEALDRAIRPEELHVSSTRGGSIPGIHTVTLDSPSDSVEITHTVRNRKGLATGAVLALEWLQGKKGFYRVEDFIDAVINPPPAEV